MVETGVDLCLFDCPLAESPTTRHVRLNVQHVIVEVERFYYELLKIFLTESRKAGKQLRL